MYSGWHRAFCGVGIVASLGVLAFAAPATHAAPFTDHFDALIADLETRAVGLSTSTDRVERKEYRVILLVLNTLEGTTSTSVAADIRHLGTVAKTLVRVFPSDFTPAGSSLVTNLQTALDGLASDVQATVDATHVTIDALPPSLCRDKAEAALDRANALIGDALSADDFAAAARLLGAALSLATRTPADEVRCTSVVVVGGNFMKATVSGDISGSFHTTYPSAVYSGFLDQYNITGGDANGLGITLVVAHVGGPGTYALATSTDLTRTSPLAAYLGGTGTVTFVTVDPGGQGLVGTFSFSAPRAVPDSSGSVTVTNGSFSISAVVTVP